MRQAIDITKPQDQQTRVELTLGRVARSWRSQLRGNDFTQGLVDFFKAISNQNTLRSYSFAILEFFDWYNKTKHTLPAPDRVRRADAVEYAQWLSTRDRGLDKWRIEQDPARKFDAAIFEFIEKNPGTHIDRVREAMGRVLDFVTRTIVIQEDGSKVSVPILKVDVNSAKTGGLNRHLACLVEKRNLLRKPSIEDIRNRRVDLGYDNPQRAGIDFEVDSKIFQYWIPAAMTPEGPERASTIAARLRALSSLWSHYTKQGENLGSGEPLLRFNIWSSILRDVRPQAESQMAVSRAQHTPSVNLFDKLLATTYQKTHKQNSLQAAQAKLRGQPVQESIRRTSFKDLRDRALMLLMVQMGLRATEVSRLKRSDLSGEPPLLVVHGKRDKKRILRVPPVVLQALNEMNLKMEQMAQHQTRYRMGEPSRAMQQLSSGAPLIPAVMHWGINSYHTRPTKPLSRQAIDVTLRRRAVRAGFEKGTMEYIQAHPHGLRHLFAQIATASGTSMPKLQAIMGHSDISVTGRYVEERRPEELIADAFKPAEPSLGPMEALGATPEHIEIQPVPIVSEETIKKPKVLSVKRAKSKKAPAETVPEPQKLTGFGEIPSMTEREKKDIEQEIEKKVHIGKERTRAEMDSLKYLDSLYEDHWGEKGKVQRLIDPKAVSSVAAMQPKYKPGTEMKLLGIEAIQTPAEFEGIDLTEAEESVEIVAIGDVKKLTQTYIGKKSALLWWYGVSGQLRPQMPVMSMEQAGECSTREQSSICERLSQLWSSWYSSDEEGKGPSAAAALASWIVESLDESAQVEKERDLRDAKWVPFDAPIGETQVQKGQRGDQRQIFREHESKAVVQWFSDVAWRYEVSYGGGKDERTLKVKDAPYPDPPSWYGVEDPIGALSLSERSLALDWIAAISGQHMTDKIPKYSGVSRADIDKLIGAMCTYDEKSDELTKERKRGNKAEQVQLRSHVKSTVQEVTSLVNRLTMGRVQDFDIEKIRKERAAIRRGAKSAKRVSRSGSYVDMLVSLFGDEVAQDPAIQVRSHCGKKPLQEGFAFIDQGRELFRVEGGTIRHTDDFKLRFAQQTGTHSECVARRIARDLWELKKSAMGGKRQGAIERSDEMQQLVISMTGYRVPCPQVMEREIRSMLGKPSEPQPVFEAWDRVRRKAPDESWFPDDEFAELQEQYGGDAALGEFFEGGSLSGMFVENPQSRPFAYRPNVRHLMPNPVAMLFVAFLR